MSACVALVLLAGLAGANPELERTREEGAKLEAIRVELDQRRAAMRDLDVQKKGLVDSLGELDESLAALDDAAAATRAKQERLRAAIGSLHARAGLDEDALANAQRRLETRLRTLFVDGEGGVARALLGAEGFEELALRRRFVQTLAENDSRLVAEVTRLEEGLRAKKDELRRADEELAFNGKQIEEQRSLLTATRAERQAAIDRIANERALAEQRAKELEQKRAEMSAFLRKLVEEQNRRPMLPATKKGILKGNLAWPVNGVVIRKFGIVKDKDTRAEIVSNGLEIRAELGAPIVAAAQGRVVHVGFMRGFGRVVIVDHGEGHHTISAHIQRAAVSRGDEVTKGQVIAYVGDTESTNGPKLYFELRENSRPRDPLPFMKR